ncbi:plant expansin [Coniophora puteana RWD-64-598 SS2]|uniref:Plant expansin n=1 Tax=Coniophora puteana (strain RWD-64-598) TaxID=741705 RepID=R7SG28_CONPW|nr:plant expansin [Coniophora puteana RWD-64-598 SS2]EIW74044.1 plant expansin [Coniophora puteana RWD-64-598 SS2]
MLFSSVALAVFSLAISANAAVIPEGVRNVFARQASTSTVPPPSSTVTPPPSSTVSATPSPTSTLPPFLVGTQTGDGTFYTPGLGACGITNTEQDMIVAVSETLFDTFPGYTGTNPNNNPVCNQKISATYGSITINVTVTDRCTACALTDLDFTPAGFQQFAPETAGRIHGVQWDWIDLVL